MLEAQMEDELEQQSHLDVTLTNTTLLSIFFGLVVICGVFFGFGYSLGGHKSAAQTPSKEFSSPRQLTETAALAPGATTMPRAVESSPAKPSAGMVTAASSSGTADKATTLPAVIAAPKTAPAAVSDHAIATATKAKPTAGSITTAAVAPTDAATTPGKTYMVQVAALAHSGDADILCNALRRKGYTVIVASGKQDKLLHVQVGPFATLDDAKAMRDRLSGDGYSPILK
jgi:cell division septation protein DedD